MGFEGSSDWTKPLFMEGVRYFFENVLLDLNPIISSNSFIENQFSPIDLIIFTILILILSKVTLACVLPVFSLCSACILLVFNVCSSFGVGLLKMTLTKDPLSEIFGSGKPTLIHSLFIIDKPRPQYSINPLMNIMLAITGFGGSEVFSSSCSSSSVNFKGERFAGNLPAFSITILSS